MKQLLNGLGILLTRDIKARIRSGKITPKSKSKGTTLVKSAKLLNSISYLATDSRVTIGTNIPYARIHHEGGIIRPRNAQYLAIPLTKEAAARKPREFTNTFIAKGIIFRKRENGEPEALYALKKSVTMPPRPYMIVTDQSKAAIEQLIITWLDTRFKKGAK
jgi:phage gpG-like protein